MVFFRLVMRIRRCSPTALILSAGLLLMSAQSVMGQDKNDDQPTLTSEQLEELVAPIALYPDKLIAIVLAASTYPLEVVFLARLQQFPV